MIPLASSRKPNIRDAGKFLLADVVEDANSFNVYVDLPGVEKENLDVSIANGYLHVKAERPECPCPEECGSGFLKRIERHCGKKQRSIRLPTGANPDVVETKLCHGVLCVKFEKLPAFQPARKLNIT